MGMGSVRGVRMREDREAHGVRGGFPPKGGKPHHPHGRRHSHPHALTVIETQTLHDGEPTHWWEWDRLGRSADETINLNGGHDD